MRVVIIKDFVKTNFPTTPLLDFAVEVEKITTSKVHTSECISLTYIQVMCMVVQDRNQSLICCVFQCITTFVLLNLH